MADAKLGKIGAVVTGASVTAFALAMLVGLISGLNTSMVSYFV